MRFLVINLLLLIVVRAVRNHKHANLQPSTEQGPCTARAALFGRKDRTLVFGHFLTPNRRSIKKYVMLPTLHPTSWTSGWGESSLSKEIFCNTTECLLHPQPLLPALLASSWTLFTSLPMLLFLRGREGGWQGLAVAQEETLPFSVWNYNSCQAKQCQQCRGSFDSAKWMDTLCVWFFFFSSFPIGYNSKNSSPRKPTSPALFSPFQRTAVATQARFTC